MFPVLYISTQAVEVEGSGKGMGIIECLLIILKIFIGHLFIRFQVWGNQLMLIGCCI